MTDYPTLTAELAAETKDVTDAASLARYLLSDEARTGRSAGLFSLAQDIVAMQKGARAPAAQSIFDAKDLFRALKDSMPSFPYIRDVDLISALATVASQNDILKSLAK